MLPPVYHCHYYYCAWSVCRLLLLLPPVFHHCHYYCYYCVWSVCVLLGQHIMYLQSLLCLAPASSSLLCVECVLVCAGAACCSCAITSVRGVCIVCAGAACCSCAITTVRGVCTVCAGAVCCSCAITTVRGVHHYYH